MRQKRLLFILLAILVLSTIYAIWATPRSDRSVETTATNDSSTRAEVQTEQDTDWPGLRIELLKSESRKYPGYTRDIFGPLFPRPKVRRRPPPQKVVEPVAPAPPAPPQPPKVVEREVREALERFTFLGFLDKKSKRTVFLASGEEIFLVTKGDRFGEKGRFTVLDITEEELTIRQGDHPRLISITLVEEAPLVPSF